MAEYTGYAAKAGTYAQVFFVPDSNPEQSLLTLNLSWHSIDKDLRWTVHQQGTREELISFIEEWVPRCPDPKLLGEAIDKLQIPEGVI